MLHHEDRKRTAYLHLSLTKEVRHALSEVEGSASICVSKLLAG
jgi:hypothetical protein